MSRHAVHSTPWGYSLRGYPRYPVRKDKRGYGLSEYLYEKRASSDAAKFLAVAGIGLGIPLATNLASLGLSSTMQKGSDEFTKKILGGLSGSDREAANILSKEALGRGVEHTEDLLPRWVQAPNTLYSAYYPGYNAITTPGEASGTTLAHEFGHHMDFKGKSKLLKAASYLNPVGGRVNSLLTLAAVPTALYLSGDPGFRDFALKSMAATSGVLSVPLLTSEASASIGGLRLLKKLNNGKLPKGAVVDLAKAFGTYALHAGTSVGVPLAVMYAARRFQN